MIDFLPFQAEHAYQMDWIEKDDFLFSLKQTPQFFQILEANGDSQTMVKYIPNKKDGDLYPEEIMGIITAERETESSCYINMSMSAAIQQYFSKDVLKGLIAFLEKVHEQYPRIKAYGKASNAKLTKLMKAIGFHEECKMPYFGNRGETYIQFARIKAL